MTVSLPFAVYAAGDGATAQLKKAVIDSQKDLGVLNPSQKKIFDEEVVPQFQLFIKDYHESGGSMSVQVDTSAIRNYISYSVAKNLTTGTNQLLMFLRVDNRCSKCTDAEDAVHAMMQNRAVNRGFTPVWLTAEELVDVKASDLAEKRNAAGSLEMTLKPAPMDDVDSAHADEKRFLDICVFDIRGLNHYQDQSEIYDTDSYDLTSVKLLTQAFTELGAKASSIGAGASAKQEILIEVSGVMDFAKYNQLKTLLQAKMKDVAWVEERKIARGKYTFALKTTHSVDELKALASQVHLDKGSLNVIGTVVGSQGPSIQMEVR